MLGFGVLKRVRVGPLLVFLALLTFMALAAGLPCLAGEPLPAPSVTAEQVLADSQGAADTVVVAVKSADESLSAGWSWGWFWGLAASTLAGASTALLLIRQVIASPLVQKLLGPGLAALISSYVTPFEEAVDVLTNTVEDLKEPLDQAGKNAERKKLQTERQRSASPAARAIIKQHIP